MPGATPLLSIQGLTLRFKGASRPALQDISLAINKGETLGLVGESGSGKSVTSLLATGLLPQRAVAQLSGHIIWQPEGEPPLDVLQATPQQLRALRGKAVAMIFQEPMSALNPLMRVGSQLTEALRLHQGLGGEAATTAAAQLFEEVRLPTPRALLRRYPHELSGGQKQRVMIAMALAGQPQLLIADEPTTALDVSVQQTILHLLNELKASRGMSLLFISHGLAVVGQLAQRVAVLRQGVVVEQGAASTVFSQPQHPYTQGLLLSRPGARGKSPRLPTVAHFQEAGIAATLAQPEFQTYTPRELDAQLQALDDKPPLLQVQDLHVGYGKPQNLNWVVKGVSFTLRQGEALGLVGESGCGKSTLSRAILRLTAAQQGRVALATQGQPIDQAPNLLQLPGKAFRPYRKAMQLIFQDPAAALNPKHTIGALLAEPLLVHKLLPSRQARLARVQELLEQVGLGAEHMARYPHELSGGQKQRVCIARALAVQPRLLICDESVSALDVSVQAQVLNLLRELQERLGLSLLFISHDLGVVHYFCHRILVMQEGLIVEGAPAHQLMTAPSHPYTQKLLAAQPRLAMPVG